MYNQCTRCVMESINVVVDGSQASSTQADKDEDDHVLIHDVSKDFSITSTNNSLANDGESESSDTEEDNNQSKQPWHRI